MAPSSTGESAKRSRQNDVARRPVKVANCSGYKDDPAWQMLRQATMGEVDFITGDYLAGDATSSPDEVLKLI